MLKKIIAAAMVCGALVLGFTLPIQAEEKKAGFVLMQLMLMCDYHPQCRVKLLIN